MATSLLFRNTVHFKELHDLFRNTDPGTSCSKEQEAVLAGGNVDNLGSIDETTQNDGSSSAIPRSQS
jgi:hypothetical protein